MYQVTFGNTQKVLNVNKEYLKTCIKTVFEMNFGGLNFKILNDRGKCVDIPFNNIPEICSLLLSKSPSLEVLQSCTMPVMEAFDRLCWCECY